MKVRIIAYTVSIVAIALIQSTILDYVKIFDVKPNIMVVFIISTALLRGSVEGAVTGFAAGLMQDIISGKILGLYSLLGLYLGLIIGLLNRRLYRDNFLVVIFFTFTASIAYEWVLYFLATFTKSRIELLFPLKNIILPEAVYNSVASIFIYIFVIRLNTRFENTGKISRKY